MPSAAIFFRSVTLDFQKNHTEKAYWLLLLRLSFSIFSVERRAELTVNKFVPTSLWTMIWVLIYVGGCSAENEELFVSNKIPASGGSGGQSGGSGGQSGSYAGGTGASDDVGVGPVDCSDTCVQTCDGGPKTSQCTECMDTVCAKIRREWLDTTNRKEIRECVNSCSNDACRDECCQRFATACEVWTDFKSCMCGEDG